MTDTSLSRPEIGTKKRGMIGCALDLIDELTKQLGEENQRLREERDRLQEGYVDDATLKAVFGWVSSQVKAYGWVDVDQALVFVRKDVAPSQGHQPSTKSRRQKMTKRDAIQRIEKAARNVRGDISVMANSDSKFARGLASEGYLGGYRDALYDVILLLNGTTPDRKWWLHKHTEGGEG